MLDNLSIEGMTAYVEKRSGPRAARIVGDIAVIAYVITCLTLIVAFPVALYTGVKWLGTEFGLTLPKWDVLPDFRVGDWSLFMFSIALSVAASAFMMRRIGRLDTQRDVIRSYISERLDPRIKKIHERLDFLEQNVPGISDVKASSDWFANEIAELKKKTTALESHTDIHGLKALVADQFKALEMLKAGYIVTIESAQYGIGQNATDSVDVKKALAGCIENGGGIDVLVNNDTLKVHPYAGRPKKLWVDVQTVNDAVF